MNKERLTAFTDAVLAIIMTILVLELEKPKIMTWSGLWNLRMSFPPKVK
ncbi:putative membrane protein [Lactobacillus colini]|uniref:Membrane protein n=1 Tax=Lactobacillus colini TaxID=1819254 RepID=A0ABS4MI36_9LACO|nr:putative membrane protein [Lactobacillus colini]